MIYFCVFLPSQIVTEGTDPTTLAFEDPNSRHLVREVSLTTPVTYNPQGDVHIVAVDCGIKNNQIRCLCERGAKVTVVPWNHPLKSSGTLGCSKTQGLFAVNRFWLWFSSLGQRKIKYMQHP